MRFQFLLIIGFIFSYGFSTVEQIDVERDSSLIYWDDRALTWDDFKGKAPKNTEFIALTHSAIRMVYGGEGTTLSFVVETVFYPKSSWKKKGATDHVLKHEQGHFDITEYYSRLLRKDLAALIFKKEENIGKDVEKLFRKHHKGAEDMQDEYDKDTNHSIDVEAQTEWDVKIQQLLDETKDYTTTSIELDVSYLFE